MKYVSTRNSNHLVSLSQAILSGLASDGGLYVPESFPKSNVKSFPTGKNAWGRFAFEFLKPYFEDDDLSSELKDICLEAFDFEIPLVTLKNGPKILELFHGPTCAFKDVGAQFLAATMKRLNGKTKIARPQLVLVATSGDTGGAVASAFSKKTKIKVAVLYPKGKISGAQEKQLTCWGDQVKAFAVQGDFDDCQRIVKEAFQSAEVRARFALISANSISLGRLLPQMVYYAGTSLMFHKKTKKKPNFIVPTGNLGNAVACYWAREMGMPIGNIHFALNANQTIADFLKTGNWSPRSTQATLANAMDVGNASNAERLRALYPDGIELGKKAHAISATDKDILDTIVQTFKTHRYIACPHTATALHAYKKLKLKNAIIVATAHPAKFLDVLPGSVAGKVKTPKALSKLMKLPSKSTEIKNNLTALLQNI